MAAFWRIAEMPCAFRTHSTPQRDGGRLFMPFTSQHELSLIRRQCDQAIWPDQIH
jgi:hypothetical protein